MDHVTQWAASHGVATMTVDGNDVEAVYRAALAGIAHIRATGQPYLLETYTYRTRGHVEPDDQGYVDKAELAAWRARDPIEQLAGKLALSPSEMRAAREHAAAVIEGRVVCGLRGALSGRVRTLDRRLCIRRATCSRLRSVTPSARLSPRKCAGIRP
jgi:pyruvate dehydrogenase E1 component alpha subunit